MSFKSPVVIGVLLGFSFCLPAILALGYLAGPRIEVWMSPVLETAVGDGVIKPWGYDLRAPWREGDRACWQIAFHKLKSAHPLSLNFFVRTNLNGEVPIKVDRERFPYRGRLPSSNIIDHGFDETWANTYCATITDDIDSDDLIIGGSFVYLPEHRLWKLDQLIPDAVIPPKTADPSKARG